MNAKNTLVLIVNFLIIKKKARGELKNKKKESRKVSSLYISSNENNNIKKLKIILNFKKLNCSLLTLNLGLLYKI